jgi:hypothetical protein
MSKKLNFTHQVVAGSLLAVFLMSSAAAQMPEQILQDTFGRTLRQLQQNPSNQPPYDQSGPGGSPNISSSKPTIDCSNIQTPLGLILCSDKNAARADWDVNAAAWAYEFSLEDVARKAFRDRHDAWVQSLFTTCRLTAPISNSQRGCSMSAILLAMVRRSAFMRTRYLTLPEHSIGTPYGNFSTSKMKDSWAT